MAQSAVTGKGERTPTGARRVPIRRSHRVLGSARPPHGLGPALVRCADGSATRPERISRRFGAARGRWRRVQLALGPPTRTWRRSSVRGTLRVLVLARPPPSCRAGHPASPSAELVPGVRRAGRALKVQESPGEPQSTRSLPALLGRKGRLAGGGIDGDRRRRAAGRLHPAAAGGGRGAGGKEGGRRPARPRPADLAGRKVVGGGRLGGAGGARGAEGVLRAQPHSSTAVDQGERRRAAALRGQPWRARRWRSPPRPSWSASRPTTPGCSTSSPSPSAGRWPGRCVRRRTALRAALDSFLLEKGMVAYATRRFTGDLDEIRQARRAARHHPQQRRQLLPRARPAAGLRLRARLAARAKPAQGPPGDGGAAGARPDGALASRGTGRRHRRLLHGQPGARADGRLQPTLPPVQEMVVQRLASRGSPAWRDLKGRRISVRPGSSYARTLARSRPRWASRVVPAGGGRGDRGPHRRRGQPGRPTSPWPTPTSSRRSCTWPPRRGGRVRARAREAEGHRLRGAGGQPEAARRA